MNNRQFKNLVITSISTGTLVAGIMGWIMINKSEIQSNLCEQDKKAQQNEYKQTIDEINWKLYALERQIGGDIQYLDVAKLVIDDEKILKLEDGFQSYGNGSFFLAVNQNDLWQYNKLNKYDYLSLIYGEKSVLSSATPNTLNILRNQLVHFWRGPENFKIKLSLINDSEQSFLPEELNIFPMISVQEVNLKSFINLGAYRKKKDIKEISSKSDITALVLRQIITNGFMIESNYENAFYKIYSAQKKRNVFYVHSKLTFENAQLPGETGYHNISFDEETFFFSKGNKGLLVKLGIPYKEINPKNYPFCQQWLIGLRVRAN